MCDVQIHRLNVRLVKRHVLQFVDASTHATSVIRTTIVVIIRTKTSCFAVSIRTNFIRPQCHFLVDVFSFTRSVSVLYISVLLAKLADALLWPLRYEFSYELKIRVSFSWSSQNHNLGYSPIKVSETEQRRVCSEHPLQQTEQMATCMPYSQVMLSVAHATATCSTFGQKGHISYTKHGNLRNLRTARFYMQLSYECSPPVAVERIICAANSVGQLLWPSRNWTI